MDLTKSNKSEFVLFLLIRGNISRMFKSECIERNRKLYQAQCYIGEEMMTDNKMQQDMRKCNYKFHLIDLMRILA